MVEDITKTKDFRSNCINVFVNEILEKLKPFEEERAAVRKKCIVFSLCFAVAFILSAIVFILLLIVGVSKEFESLLAIYLGADGFLLLWLLSTPFATAKSFENRIKSRIMPIVLSSLQNFHWNEKSRIKTEQIQEFKMFSEIHFRADDDSFWGEYKNIEIDLCETKLTLKDGILPSFSGVLIFFKQDSPFTKVPVVIKKQKSNPYLDTMLHMRVVELNKISKYCFPDMERVRLEDVEFEKKFDVFSQDQIEARCLLTTGFIDRFDNIAFAFGSKQIEASFVENKAMIVVSTNKDLFQIGNMFKPVFDFNQYKTMVEEFISILELIDELKMNQNIGL